MGASRWARGVSGVLALGLGLAAGGVAARAGAAQASAAPVEVTPLAPVGVTEGALVLGQGTSPGTWQVRGLGGVQILAPSGQLVPSLAVAVAAGVAPPPVAFEASPGGPPLPGLELVAPDGSSRILTLSPQEGRAASLSLRPLFPSLPDQLGAADPLVVQGGGPVTLTLAGPATLPDGMQWQTVHPEAGPVALALTDTGAEGTVVVTARQGSRQVRVRIPSLPPAAPQTVRLAWATVGPTQVLVAAQAQGAQGRPSDDSGALSLTCSPVACPGFLPLAGGVGAFVLTVPYRLGGALSLTEQVVARLPQVAGQITAQIPLPTRPRLGLRTPLPVPAYLAAPGAAGHALVDLTGQGPLPAVMSSPVTLSLSDGAGAIPFTTWLPAVDVPLPSGTGTQGFRLSVTGPAPGGTLRLAPLEAVAQPAQAIALTLTTGRGGRPLWRLAGVGSSGSDLLAAGVSAFPVAWFSQVVGVRLVRGVAIGPLPPAVAQEVAQHDLSVVDLSDPQVQPVWPLAPGQGP